MSEQINLFKQFENLFKAEEIGEEKKPFQKTYDYSPFALQDTIGMADNKRAWIEYQKLKFLGIEDEELIHNIVSKVRDMALISMGATVSDLGIKEYPYNKSKKDLKNWKEEKLFKFYEKLISLYHESRMGGESLDTALEKAILKL